MIRHFSVALFFIIGLMGSAFMGSAFGEMSNADIDDQKQTTAADNAPNVSDPHLSAALKRAEELLLRVRELTPNAKDGAAAEVKSLQDLITATRRASKLSSDTTVRLQDRQMLYESISKDFSRVQKQIKIGGLDGSFAKILIDRNRSLPRPLEERKLLGEIRQSLTDAQRALYFLENDPINSDGDHFTPTHKTADENASDLPKQTARQLFDVRHKLRNKLAAIYRHLISLISDLELVERQISQVSADYREFLSQHLFWERSSPVIGANSFKNLPDNLTWLAGGGRLTEFVHQLSLLPVGLYVILVGVLCALVGLRRKFKNNIKAVGDRTRRVSTDRYINTVHAFILTVLLALPVPLALLVFGFIFKSDPGVTVWSYGIGTALLNIAIFVFIVQFTKGMAIEKGLGEYHFRWEPSTLARINRLFRHLAPIYIPLSLMLNVMVAEGSAEYIDSLGRAVALLIVIGIGIVLMLFTGPELSVANESLTPQDSRLFKGNKAFWSTVFTTIGLVLLLVVGFVVTTIVLLIELQFSALALYVAFIVHALILRWFEIRERRMVLAQAIAERRARRDAADKDDEGAQRESEEKLVNDAEKDQRLTLVQVGEQMRNVIRFLVGVGLITTIYYLWAEGTPILTGLDTINIFDNFSIADMAVITLMIGLTASISRNLSGLLEILIFGLVDVAPGTRTAITSLVRYAVIAIGLIAISRQAQVDWSQFGWIAAALSVGLGFGLQEVVANFVCGIILLFERPIRVGDVVTVGGVSGTVSRIQMRATTIVNWDGEELVVPNKDFVTGSLLNMTLSNSINRLLIPVGVAYGTDTEKVIRILSEVVQGVDEVMEDPAPIITFESFGESSLDFTIRAYLPKRDNRLGVITEIHRQIAMQFAAAGIEIPFPQRDLHLRSVDEGVRLNRSPD